MPPVRSRPKTLADLLRGPLINQALEGERRNPVTIPVLTPQGPRINITPEEREFGEIDWSQLPRFQNPFPLQEGRRAPLTEQEPLPLTPEARAFLEKLGNVTTQQGLPEWIQEHFDLTDEERDRASELRQSYLKHGRDLHAVIPSPEDPPEVQALMRLLGVPRGDPFRELLKNADPNQESMTYRDAKLGLSPGEFPFGYLMDAAERQQYQRLPIHQGEPDVNIDRDLEAQRESAEVDDRLEIARLIANMLRRQQRGRGGSFELGDYGGN